MGQKTNPIGNRLGIIRGWDSNWYGGRNYGDKIAEDEKIRKKHPTFYKAMTDGDIPSSSAMVDLIILKCKDEEGNSIFAQADSMYLLNQDVGYITGIATAMLEKLFDIPTVETIEGN